jgi:undecaprenyl-phosphate 4-deoxy-4-formamido-L-arabinose transferase
MKISIAIPVFNSENTIQILVQKLIYELSDFEIEIILVNDCSTDNSEDKCIDIFQKNTNKVKFYSLSKNVGEHNTVMAALNNCSGDYVVIMDDDFQNPVYEVKNLIHFVTEKKFDVVYTYYKKKKHSIFRNLGSKFNDKIANIMLDKPKNLYLSSFKVINKFIVTEIIKYDLPFPYIDGLILRTTSNIGKLRVEHSERKDGKSQYNLIKLISLWLNMLTNFSILPLRFAIFLGFIFSIIGFLLAFAGILMKFLDPSVPLGYASQFVVITIFGGIQLIATGMVGEYIGRIFVSMNKKPQFSIKKRFESFN